MDEFLRVCAPAHTCAAQSSSPAELALRLSLDFLCQRLLGRLAQPLHLLHHQRLSHHPHLSAASLGAHASTPRPQGNARHRAATSDSTLRLSGRLTTNNSFNERDGKSRALNLLLKSTRGDLSSSCSGMRCRRALLSSVRGSRRRRSAAAADGDAAASVSSYLLLTLPAPVVLT